MNALALYVQPLERPIDLVAGRKAFRSDKGKRQMFKNQQIKEALR